jgi:alpha-1,6-mannosyltransferase
MKHRLALLACIVFTAATALAAWTSSAPAGTRGSLYIVAHLVASAAMLLAFAVGEDSTLPIVLTGVLCRLLLIPVPPYTTHDVTRYMFDGAMVLAGLDPYAVSPGDVRAAAVAAIWPTALEHARYPTLYPPLALWAFSSCARFGPAAAWLVWKAVVGCASVATLVVARQVARGRLIALVALSPLLVLEGGIGGHLDILCAMAVTLACSEQSQLMRGTWVGVGVLLKLTPLPMIGPITISYLRRTPVRALGTVVGFVSVIAAAYWIAHAKGFQAVGSLRTFFDKWSFGSPWIFVDASREVVLGVALGLALLTCLASAGLAWRRALGPALMLAACAPFVGSPVVFPWYLCTAAALLCVWPSWTVIAWVTTLPLTYEVIDRFDVDNTWFPARWPISVMCVAVLAGAIADVWLVLRRRASVSPSMVEEQP